jgi:S-formylglutathione hydrolase FrmB
MWLYGILLLVQLPHDPAPRGRVETIQVLSSALGTVKDVTVYLPPTYDSAQRRFPTVYYLHGATGNERSWLDRLHVDLVADSLIRTGLPEIIIVMPDGDTGYWTDWASTEGFATQCAGDSLLTAIHEQAATFCVKFGRYEAYMVADMAPAIDARYRTLATPTHRAIAGFSMGGYGAFFLALRHPDLWGAAVSHSGVLAPLYIGPHPYNGHPRYAATVEEILASWPPHRRALFAIEFGTDTATWWARDPFRQLQRLQADHRPLPELFFDVGSSDRFADQSRALADTLRRLRIRHTFAEWPGDHNDAYWRAHVGEGLTWVLRHFARSSN